MAVIKIIDFRRWTGLLFLRLFDKTLSIVRRADLVFSSRTDPKPLAFEGQLNL